MSDTSTIAELATALLTERPMYHKLGKRIGRIYTDHGFPIDMALARLQITPAQKLVVLDGAFEWLIEHKRQSGASEKAIERQRATNQRSIEAYIRTGETGVY